MANVKSKTTKAEVSKAPSSKPDLAQLTDFDKPADVIEDGKPAKGPKPSTEMVPDLSDYGPQELRSLGAELLTELQIEESVSISFPDDKLGDLAVKHGARGVVDEFAPADAVEIHLRAGDRWHSKCRDGELTLGDKGLCRETRCRAKHGV